MNRSRHLVVRAVSVVGLISALWLWTVQAPAPVSGAVNCDDFGSGMTVPVNKVDISGLVKHQIVEACKRFPSRIDRPNGNIYWWRGLIVQDYFGTSGNENGTIFYDANKWQGNGSAYVLWGPILTEIKKPTNTWGPPMSDVTDAWPSPPRGDGSHQSTTGTLVRFDNLDAYYNNHKKGVFVVSDVAKRMFDSLGGTGGFLGFPEADGAWAYNSGASGAQGFFQPFSGGIMHTWKNGNTWVAYPVYGAIQAVYNSLPGPSGGIGSGSYLGFPTDQAKPIGNAPKGEGGVIQEFEGGAVVYVNPPGGLEDGRIGVTHVIYKDIYQRLKSDGVLFQTTGMPVGNQGVPDNDHSDDIAYFQNGYATAAGGFKKYDTIVPHPPLPDLLFLPYDSNDRVVWTGAPHAYGKFPDTVLIATNTGSGMDFSSGAHFSVRAMASGTVEAMEDLSSGFGSYVVIRSQPGGTAILYGHLDKDSTVIYRAPDGSYSPEESDQCRSVSLPEKVDRKGNCFRLRVGMYVHAREVFAREGSSGTTNKHLHVELMSGTRETSGYSPSHRYSKFGPPISWDGVMIGSDTGPKYIISPFRKDQYWDFNYDGSAIDTTHSQSRAPCSLRFMDYRGTNPATNEKIEVEVTGTVLVDGGYSCTPGQWAASNSVTIFAIGRLITDLAAGDVPLDVITSSSLVSTDPNAIVTYDPNTVTLDSPFLVPPTTPTLYLPNLSKASSPSGTSPVFPTPTPPPPPTPTATPPTPGSIILSAPDFNNGGFETGTMEGWAMPNGTIDVDGSFVHSGSYSVHGTSASGAVSFYRDYAMLPYQFWSDAGRLQTTTTGWFQNGDSEDYRVLVHYIGTSGTDLAAFDSGWKHDPGGDYVQMADANRAVPAGTTVIRLEVQIRRNSGSYTDVDVDDLTVQLNFVGP